ncbi:VirB4 family type IV secretion/conjugal transfer ATPase [Anaerobiospirillum sp. NML120511]|uniref:VirB4 family type IV secretion/conjugal transfer ATPase n=1 Tax=Anaerobiospirillum sp. NML120511 TaxID=2932819 RepID=UPI001FF21C7A|nr:VirB4 family type IV secretion/conjugal transfer ATPase [Anaerobiospirillum sp. NML120511]MCK0535746.1 VirB4 family type IV secretion/conjugal transfer ATPase [Anaerobiospirillum sp. NML120511]
MGASNFKESIDMMRAEGAINNFIPLSSVVAPGVVMGRDGELISSFIAKGITFETADDIEIDQGINNLNILYRTISNSNYALQLHRLRRPMQDELNCCSEKGFAHELSKKYNETIGKSRLVATELYLTLIMKRRGKLTSKYRSKDEIEADIAKQLEEFENVSSQFQRSLSRFDVVKLGEYESNGKLYSDQLAFYNFLLTGKMQPVRVPYAPLHEALGAVQIFAGADTLEIQTADSKAFAQCIELKDYTQDTFSGILDGLLYPDKSHVKPYVFIETQTFCFLSKVEGQKFLQIQQKQLLASNDAGVSQIRAMDEAIDGVINGNFSIGEYSYSLMVFGDSVDIVKQNTQDAVKKLQDEGFLPIVSTLALPAAFFSQLPCNFDYRPRIARITSKNFAHLAPLHNFDSGKRNGNPWGEALALLTTPSDQPYYFNFHTSPAGEDSFDKKTLANTTIIGTSGSGKTVLLNFLIAMAQKYRNDGYKLTTVFFDKDCGAEIAIRAMKGGYLSVKNGIPTGFNPFYLEKTEANIQFLISFMKLLIKMDEQPILISDELALTEAVRAVMDMPRELRRIGIIPQFLPQGLTKEEKENSLAKRLYRWIGNGDLAWVFDNPVDTLDFDRYPNFGIDGTDFLDNPQVRTPLGFYLLYRMESVLDGRRFFFVMDEFWKWLLDDAFSDFAFNKLKTIRKQNGFGVFATQSPSDVISSPIAKAVIEQSATQIFLPNPRADRDDYINGFKVTPSEFYLISQLGEDSRLMLIKQGHKSVVCRLDLSAFGKELKILSGSTDNILLVEELIKQYGEAPDNWLPHFYENNK